ncbi:MAG: hypothetical protein KAR42_07615 [candidate division Zixibacteria bacterium]|nr:hypothetical protein [candidate division Zixibacteria bacterium]
MDNKETENSEKQLLYDRLCNVRNWGLTIFIMSFYSFFRTDFLKWPQKIQAVMEPMNSVFELFTILGAIAFFSSSFYSLFKFGEIKFFGNMAPPSMETKRHIANYKTAVYKGVFYIIICEFAVWYFF